MGLFMQYGTHLSHRREQMSVEDERQRHIETHASWGIIRDHFMPGDVLVCVRLICGHNGAYDATGKYGRTLKLGHAYYVIATSSAGDVIVEGDHNLHFRDHFTRI